MSAFKQLFSLTQQLLHKDSASASRKDKEQSSTPSADGWDQVHEAVQSLNLDPTLNKVPTLTAVSHYAKLYGPHARGTIRRRIDLLRTMAAQLEAQCHHPVATVPNAALPYPLLPQLNSSCRIVCTLTQKGAFCYLSMSALDCLAACLQQVQDLKHELRCSDEFFDRHLMPPLCRLAQTVLMLPASEGNHDATFCGLLHHSLLTATNAVAATRMRSHQLAPMDSRRVMLYMVMQGLLHDVGKLITDMYITTDEERVFRPGEETMQDLLQTSATPFFFVSFVSGRGKQHSQPLADPVLALQLQRIQLYIWQGLGINLHYEEQWARYGAGKALYTALINTADREAVSATRQALKYQLDIPTYVSCTLITLLQKINFNGMALPYGVLYTTQGLLLTKWSPLLLTLSQYYSAYFGQQRDANYAPAPTLLQALRTCGVMPIAGRFRARLWYCIYLQDELLFIEGIIINLPQSYLGDLQYCVECLALGAKADPVADIIAHHQKQETQQDPLNAMVLSLPRILMLWGPKPSSFLSWCACVRRALCPHSVLISYLPSKNATAEENAEQLKPPGYSFQPLYKSIIPLTREHIVALGLVCNATLQEQADDDYAPDIAQTSAPYAYAGAEQSQTYATPPQQPQTATSPAPWDLNDHDLPPPARVTPTAPPPQAMSASPRTADTCDLAASSAPVSLRPTKTTPAAATSKRASSSSQKESSEAKAQAVSEETKPNPPQPHSTITVVTTECKQ